MALLLRPKYLLVYKNKKGRAKKNGWGEKCREEKKKKRKRKKRREEEEFKKDSKVWNYEFLYEFPYNCMISSLPQT